MRKSAMYVFIQYLFLSLWVLIIFSISKNYQNLSTFLYLVFFRRYLLNLKRMDENIIYNYSWFFSTWNYYWNNYRKFAEWLVKTKKFPFWCKISIDTFSLRLLTLRTKLSKECFEKGQMFLVKCLKLSKINLFFY